MKNKLVLWGKDPKENRVLLGLELKPDENQVLFLVFPETVATEEFSQQMLNEWRQSKEIAFPVEPTVLNIPLKAGGSLLPDGYQVEREDVVQRAQTEWQFIVLSNKLYSSYHSEVEEFKDRIEQIGKFDSGLWEELKGFWDKVQDQVKERNLFRDHANELREKTNALFSRMKEFRNALDKEFQEGSRERKDYFMQAIASIEERMEQNMRLQTLFEELKQLQKEYRNTKLTKGHKNKVWAKLDATFKAIKEKRFGPDSVQSGNNPYERLKKRYEGLLNAIDRMQNSIRRDRKDEAFENKRLATTDGQLEAQIRQAKVAMIEERIRSKEAKLVDMEKTKLELEARLEKEKAREERRQEEIRKRELAKELKKKIAQDIQEASESRENKSEMLEKAAEQIAESKSKSKRKTETKESRLKPIMEAISTVVAYVNKD